ncbi:sensor histidine kinase [Chitinophaga nivalis]|uniref:Histidine kinase n=1 Tax=Chitinophaga nivalis TaxID=2991709 RepID=A0ABT3ITS1_9BACT|nr:histidine kinase [Chitinophaga nivalis]MCW3463014.1 histidine kinase [Chitinophaga nivalis]MCW3487296.1 histidine kinase [Chitinophaga nivalis]
MRLIQGNFSIPHKYKVRWLAILICYTAFASLVFCLVFITEREALYKNYGPPHIWVINIVHDIIKCTIIYYFLIYWIFLPIIQTKRITFRVVLPKLLQLILFAIVLTTYEFYRVFDIRGGVGDRQHLSRYDYSFWELSIGIIILLISLIVAIFIELRARQVRLREMEKGKLMAELSAIKYQINPHFLFNCLNFIYTKSVRHNQEVAHAVNLLSEIMRYALEQDDDKEGVVLLVTEMEHLKNVIEINQMRFNNNLKIRFTEKIDNLNIRIPPLVLITLVENAFKHGELNDEHNPLDIKIQVTKEKLWFYTQNKKKKSVKELSSGIGLTNVRQRLQLVYGSRHQFQTMEDDQYYVTELTINP